MIALSCPSCLYTMSSHRAAMYLDGSVEIIFTCNNKKCLSNSRMSVNALMDPNNEMFLESYSLAFIDKQSSLDGWKINGNFFKNKTELFKLEALSTGGAVTITSGSGNYSGTGGTVTINAGSSTFIPLSNFGGTVTVTAGTTATVGTVTNSAFSPVSAIVSVPFIALPLDESFHKQARYLLKRLKKLIIFS